MLYSTLPCIIPSYLYRIKLTIHKTCLELCLEYSRCSINVTFLIYHRTVPPVTFSACLLAVTSHSSLQWKLGQYCFLPFLLTNRILRNPFKMNLQKCRVTVFVNHFNGKKLFLCSIWTKPGSVKLKQSNASHLFQLSNNQIASGYIQSR